MAGRPSKTRRLDVWMNGQLVGQWSIAANGVQQFAYDASWHDSPAARPLSLSLPLSLGTKAVSGHAVASYFDNLLPDSAVIRARIASRHGAASDEAFRYSASTYRETRSARERNAETACCSRCRAYSGSR